MYHTYVKITCFLFVIFLMGLVTGVFGEEGNIVRSGIRHTADQHCIVLFLRHFISQRLGRKLLSYTNEANEIITYSSCFLQLFDPIET